MQCADYAHDDDYDAARSRRTATTTTMLCAHACARALQSGRRRRRTTAHSACGARAPRVRFVRVTSHVCMRRVRVRAHVAAARTCDKHAVMSKSCRLMAACPAAASEVRSPCSHASAGLLRRQSPCVHACMRRARISGQGAHCVCHHSIEMPLMPPPHRR